MPEWFPAGPNQHFPLLFAPGSIGSLRLKNRIVMPPMGTQLASDTGAPSSRMLHHYERRALGGVGLIIVEFTCVDYPRGKGHACQLALHDDKLIAAHARLVDAVHRAGAKVSVQLHHAGGNTRTSWTEGLELVSPGLVPSLSPEEQPHILRGKEIPELIEKFALAVQRAKSAGYDSVELHGAHGYLISEFMSPYINKRADQWGGSVENRMRFPLAVISRAKELVGRDFPITFRLSGAEYVPGGRTIEETVDVAKMLAAAHVEALHISAGVDTDFDWMVDPIYAPQGRKVDLAAAVARAVDIPVIAVGVIREPAFAESVLAERKADFVAIGRGLLADPDWPKKAFEGHPQTIRRCISCNYCDGVRNQSGRSVACVANPNLGREADQDQYAPAATKKRVMVVGGGPAGIEVSRIAALKKHDVILYERSHELGGQLRLAAKAPGKEKIQWLIEDLVSGLESSGARVRLDTEVTETLVTDTSPDVVVVATGGQPTIPQIPGADSNKITTAWAVIDGNIPSDCRHFVVIGGNSTGCEAAMALASQSSEMRIVLLEQMSGLAADTEPFARQATRREIAETGSIEVQLGWRAVEITDRTVRAQNVRGEVNDFLADCVVLAVGVTPTTQLLERLRTLPQEAYVLGDASRPGNIASALNDAQVLGGWL